MIIRRLTSDKHAALIANPELREIDLVIVPHIREEFGNELPNWLLERSHFASNYSRPVASDGTPLHAGYVLDGADFVLVTTPGGGFEEIAHICPCGHRSPSTLGNATAQAHCVVRGPNSSIPLEPVDDRMTVVDVEPDLVSLFALSH